MRLKTRTGKAVSEVTVVHRAKADDACRTVQTSGVSDSACMQTLLNDMISSVICIGRSAEYADIAETT